MSFQAMAWAVDLALPTHPKFVLIMLSNYASDTGESYPSINTLARDTALSQDTVMRAIKALEAERLLVVERRKVDGVNLPNVYRLCIGRRPQGVPSRGDHPPQAATTTVPAGSDHSPLSASRVPAGSDSNQSLNLSKEEVGADHSAATSKAGKPEAISFDAETGRFCGPISDHFGRWTRAYPALVLDVELARIEAWLVANPANRKSNYLRFITNWLQRSQDRAPRVGANTGAPHGSSTPAQRRAEFVDDMRRAADSGPH